MGVEGAVRAGVEGKMDWIAEDRIHRWFVFSLFSVGLYNYSTLLYSNLLFSNPYFHHLSLSNLSIPFSPLLHSPKKKKKISTYGECPETISTNPFPFEIRPHRLRRTPL